MRTIAYWDERLQLALNEYRETIDNIEDNYDAYKGIRKIKTPDGTDSRLPLTSVRKVVFELIEAQVDHTVPQPKVTSVFGYKDKAQIVEHYIKNELDRLDFEEMNDEMARITPIAGASVFYVEWDNSIRTRNTIGKLVVRNIFPTQIVPQPGVYKLDDMDYIFMQLRQSREEIRTRYGVDVKDENETDPSFTINTEDLITHNFVYYRNEERDVCLFSWVGDKIIQDMPNYFGRKREVCAKCGAVWTAGSKECDVCQHTKSKVNDVKEETLKMPDYEMDVETGEMIEVERTIKVPYYKPRSFPFIIRKNTSEAFNFLGSSDVQMIKDQQNELNIYTTKVREKLLKGGSIVTMPKGLNFKPTNEELKMVEVSSPAQADQIKVFNLQPNVNNDMNMLSMNYQIARDTIGITDSFQGKRDTTATSGRAKEVAASQTAGRLESKKKMRDFAYAKLFQLMFQFILAYSDEPRSYSFNTEDGDTQYGIFDKRLFLDNDGENWWWDDEYIFATDISATLSTNRLQMWEETRLNFTSGAYGMPNDLATILMFWQMMDALHYPGAKPAVKFAAQRLEEQKQQMQQQMQMEQQAREQDMAMQQQELDIENQNTQADNMAQQNADMEQAYRAALE